ncbi:MAG: DUF4912 domain-containing protein, partial [Candidatus Omnitrophota bacterium]|nr:DUF4912 domain-containing protein [Candidatus Omnitrophota bacterium]
IKKRKRSVADVRMRPRQTALPYISKKDFVDTYDLPSRYNTTNLTLISRDPHFIHAYWEISPSSVETLRNKIDAEFNRIIYTLRMYDVNCVHFNGSNANHWFDLDFDPNNTNSWYVNLWCDNVTYCGEIGAKLPDGKFVPITRSNTVTTPRKAQSHRAEEIWMKVDDRSSGAPFVVAEPQSGRKSIYAGRQPGAGARRRICLTEDDIRAYYTRMSPLLGNILAERLAKLRAHEGYSLILRDGKAALDEILRRGMGKGRFLKRLLSGASEELVLFGGASELGASERPGASEREELKRKFFFEIGTELIVYGRTEPDATVSLGNKNIPLRGDGTFSLRFALPDGGKIPLDFTARSRDGLEKHRIDTGVERKFSKYE